MLVYTELDDLIPGFYTTPFTDMIYRTFGRSANTHTDEYSNLSHNTVLDFGQFSRAVQKLNISKNNIVFPVAEATDLGV